MLEKVLKPNAKQHMELAQLRTHIRRCFSSIRCFLMPHPGLEVATNQQFDGRLNVIDTSFRGALMELMPILFRPEHIVPKQIDSVDVEIGELVGAPACFDYAYSLTSLLPLLPLSFLSYATIVKQKNNERTLQLIYFGLTYYNKYRLNRFFYRPIWSSVYRLVSEWLLMFSAYENIEIFYQIYNSIARPLLFN